MAKRLAKKVLLIGWDAADWKMIHPLLDSGLMPALEKFISGGVMGNIATLSPPLSPILWNSIATGKLPEKHGIYGFAEPLPDGTGIRSVSSTSRRCKAIWNILTQEGFRTNVVGWFASHPAEPINGVCVSNDFFTTPKNFGEPYSFSPKSVHPERLLNSLAELRVHPNEIEAGHVLPLMPRAGELNQDLPEEKKPLAILSKYLAECGSTHAVATSVMETEPWDFMAIYYNAIDLLGHYFMQFHPPYREQLVRREFELFKDVMNGVYRFHDMMLQRLLELAGQDCTVILLSDHGFYSDHLRPIPGSEQARDPMSWHRSHGIVCMRGPGILADQRIYGSSLLDIVPTVLTLFGLPVGQDMDGKALVQAFENPPKIESIPTWENVPGDCGMHPPDTRIDPMASQEALKQLVELGYIAAPSDNAQKDIERVLADLECNLATSLLHYGDPLKAAKIFQKLWTSWPQERFFGISLAQAYLNADELTNARCILEKLESESTEIPFVDLMMGSLLLAEDQPEAALKRLHKAEQKAPNLPQLHVRLGSAYLRSRQWADAERAFRRALEIDGDSAQACHGLSAALLRQNRVDEAAELALRAVGLLHFFPAAHFQLGMTLARLNQPERAAMAFEHGLAMRPGVPIAHRYLARLYYRMGNARKCHEHREALARLKEAHVTVGKTRIL